MPRIPFLLTQLTVPSFHLTLLSQALSHPNFQVQPHQLRNNLRTGYFPHSDLCTGHIQTLQMIFSRSELAWNTRVLRNQNNLINLFHLNFHLFLVVSQPQCQPEKIRITLFVSLGVRGKKHPNTYIKNGKLEKPQYIFSSHLQEYLQNC